MAQKVNHNGNGHNLKLDPRNARKHSDHNKKLIRQSLAEVGAGRGVLADANGIIRAGNGIFEAWQEQGGKVKVIETDGKTLLVTKRKDLKGKDAIRAAMLDNLAADSSSYDYDAEILAEIAKDDDLIAALTKEDARLAELLRGDAKQETQDPSKLVDKAAELQAKWQVQRGDVWMMGKHRLMCGDSTNAADVATLMQGERTNAVISDVPYGMDLDTDWSEIEGSLRLSSAKNHTRGNKYERVKGDDKPFDPAHIFEQFGYCREMFLFGADYYADKIPNRVGGSWLVWDKRKESQSEAIGSEFELLWSKAKHKRRILRHDWFGFLSSQDGKDARNRQHPTQKPVSLIADIIGRWLEQGAVIFDGYIGSGTTLVACEQTGRIGRGMEIEPKYCAVTLERLAGLGLMPQRIGNA